MYESQKINTMKQITPSAASNYPPVPVISMEEYTTGGYLPGYQVHGYAPTSEAFLSSIKWDLYNNWYEPQFVVKFNNSYTLHMFRKGKPWKK